MQQGESYFPKICNDYYVIKQCKICFLYALGRRKLQNDYLQTTENHSCKSLEIFHMINEPSRFSWRFFVEVKEKPYKRFCIFEKTNSGG